jgi:hypothetical protein
MFLNNCQLKFYSMDSCISSKLHVLSLYRGTASVSPLVVNIKCHYTGENLNWIETWTKPILFKYYITKNPVKAIPYIGPPLQEKT